MTCAATVIRRSCVTTAAAFLDGTTALAARLAPSGTFAERRGPKQPVVFTTISMRIGIVRLAVTARLAAAAFATTTVVRRLALLQHFRGRRPDD
jgi:hypothetical protein